MKENVRVIIGGEDYLITPFKQVAGDVFLCFLSSLKYMSNHAIDKMVRKTFEMLQSLDQVEYNKKYRPLYKWWAYNHPDRDVTTRLITNMALASDKKGLMRGLGFCAAVRKKGGRAKVVGKSVLDPERQSIYHIDKQTKWPKGLSRIKQPKYVRRA